MMTLRCVEIRKKFVKLAKVKIVTERKSAKANCPIIANVGVWYFESYTILPNVEMCPMHLKIAIVKITQVNVISKVVSINVSCKVNPSED